MGKKDDRQKRKGDASRACVAAGECRPPHHGSKDTRHYCKGKVGVEHQWRWMQCADIPNEGFYHKKRGNTIVHERLVCIACMKLTYYTRERCACCRTFLSVSKTPAWMAVPDATHGVVKITQEEVSA